MATSLPDSSTSMHKGPHIGREGRRSVSVCGSSVTHKSEGNSIRRRSEGAILPSLLPLTSHTQGDIDPARGELPGGRRPLLEKGIVKAPLENVQQAAMPNRTEGKVRPSSGGERKRGKKQSPSGGRAMVGSQAGKVAGGVKRERVTRGEVGEAVGEVVSPQSNTVAFTPPLPPGMRPPGMRMEPGIDPMVPMTLPPGSPQSMLLHTTMLPHHTPPPETKPFQQGLPPGMVLGHPLPSLPPPGTRSLSHWELERHYYQNMALLEQQRRYTEYLEKQLKEIEETEVPNKVPNEHMKTYQQYLSYVVEPEYVPTVPIPLASYSLHGGALELKGTFDNPILPSEIDVYSKFGGQP